MDKSNETGIKVFFIGCLFSIKGSNAPSNLIRNISRGLAENGVETWLIPFSLEYGSFIGKVNGVEYYNPLAAKARPRLLINRRINRILRYIKAPIIIRKVTCRGKSIMIYFGESIGMMLYCRFLAWCFSSSLLLYSVEHPFGSGSTLTSIGKRYFLPLSRLVFDGYLCISDLLNQFYNKVNPKPTLVIPSVVDYNIYNKEYPKLLDFQYICYAGSVTIEKDGVDILLKAFALLLKEGYKIKLLIIGPFFSNETIIRELVNSLGIADFVVFTGQVDRAQIPAYFQNAKMLVLARPDNLQNRSGFPTKVPEYLASGKPVIVSDIGDLNLYLSDRENVFFVKPGDIFDLKSIMSFILNNYDLACKIGEDGRHIANTILGYKYQGMRLKEFLEHSIIGH